MDSKSGDAGLAVTGQAARSGSEGGRQTTPSLRKTARLTGVWYLGLGIAGVIGFLLIRPRLYVAGDPTATLSNLVERQGLARMGVVLELAIVMTQALAAVWFYKLFRSINHTAAFALATFGMVNAIAIMASAAFMATALSVAGDPGLAPGGDAAATAQLMYQLSSNSWGVGSVFFGLWLIPMGYIAATSGRMPKWLGRILIVGGGGYLLSALVSNGFPGAADLIADALTFPATIGEFWIIGYLLFVGIRETAGREGENLSA